MKIVITGTKGFIGKNLLNKLIDYNNIVEINEDIFISKYWKQEVEKILKIAKPDVVFHVGACSNTLENNVNHIMLLNFEFTKFLTDYCYKNNIKIIYSSSAANYGINNDYPSNLYGWSKYVGESYVISKGGVALRYFNVYGPLEENKGKMASLIYQIINKIKNKEKIKIFPLYPKRDFIYIKDVIQANILALEKYNSLSGKWYEVGYGTARCFEDILNILNVKYSYHNESEIPEGYQFFTQSDPQKWIDGWMPKYNLEDGIKDYTNYLKYEI
jgi:ADP-L-glycero-D-manno-heptose 6-epimerase